MKTKKTGNRVTCLMLVLLVGSLSLLLGAKEEEKDWQAAQRSDNAAAYDKYLMNHPDGANKRPALLAATARSREEYQKAAKGCAAPFPRMVYYTVALTDIPAVRMSDLAASVGEASRCPFSGSMKYEETVWAADGLLDSRARLENISEAKFPPRAMIDLDFILLDLEDGAILGAAQKIKFCHDQSAWVDTPKKVAFQCSLPHRELQGRYAQAMADQARSDFERVGKVADPDYRLNFWKRYKKLAKGDVMEQVAMVNQLHTVALDVMKKETDPRVAEEIENAAIRLGGGGKPRGGLPGMP